MIPDGATYVIMTMTLLKTCITFAEFQICVNKSSPQITDEQRLFMVLMKDYDRNTRPVFNASHPVNVYMGITLTQIFDVDERNQVITTNIWLDQEWDDEKLTWDTVHYNGLSVLRIPCTNIWLPDIVLYNSADDYTHGYMEALAMVSNNGHVFWPPIVKLRSTCSLDITYFPFDDQVCKIKMGSWAYDGYQVDVFNRSNPVDLSNFVSNGEWELVNVKVVRNIVYYPCCSEPFPDVTFMIHIRRRTLYYTYNVIIPCVMLSTLTLLGFWMRPDSGEKVTLGLTVLLAFSVFMLLIAENMPATSSFVPLIGIYLTTVMALTSLSVISAVVASNVNHRGSKETRLPCCFRKLVIFLSKILCMRLVYTKNETTEEEHAAKIQVVMKDGYGGLKTTLSSDSGCNLIDYENGEPAQTKNITGNKRPPVERSYELEEILRKLQVLISKEEDRERIDVIFKEWMEAAEVIDRFMFWIFVFWTFFATLFILLFMPMTKSVET